MSWEDMTGWSDDVIEFYREVEPQIISGSRIVEVGIAYGKSLAFITDLFYKKMRNIDVIGVDLFPFFYGQELENYHELTNGCPTALHACMRQLQTHVPYLRGRYHIHWGDSVEAAKTFMDHSYDMVFIDADPSYEAVKRDIEAWLPKVVSGGILAGHDYTLDPSSPYGPHPGVVQAVWERFGGKGSNNRIITRPNSTVWEVRI